MDWDRKLLFDLIAGKTQLVTFDCFFFLTGWSNNTGTTDVKMDRSVLLSPCSKKF